MSLPRIPAVDTVIKQPLEVTEFPDWFMNTLVVRYSPHRGSAVIKLRPYNYDAGVLANEEDEKILHINDLLSESERVPVVAQAMNAVLTAVALIAQERVLLEKIEAVPTGEDDSELKDKLAAVRNQMGTQ